MKSREFDLIDPVDIKLRAYGATLPELFKHAMKGMYSSLKPQGPHISYQQDVVHINKYDSERHIVVRSEGQESLLIDFLSECLYIGDMHDEAYFDVRFTLLDEQELEGTLFGVKISSYKEPEIRTILYHNLQCEQIDGLWQATIYFDR